MVAQQNKYLNEAATSVFRYESDYSIRKRCQDREDALREEAIKNRKIALLQAKNASLQDEITELCRQLTEVQNNKK